MTNKLSRQRMHDVHAGSMADLSCSIAQITIYCDL